MKKQYAEPEFDVIKFSFKNMMSDGDDPGEGGHGIVHSNAEGGAAGGNPGLD